MPRRPEKKTRRGQRDLTAGFAEHRFEVGAPDHGARLDAFLARRVKGRSREGVRRLLERPGAVEVLPGKDPARAPVGALKPGLKLRTGQEVILRIPDPEPPAERDPEALDPHGLRILYEDEHLLAVDKPPGISVHPSHGHLFGSLIHLLHERHRALYPGASEVPTLCHRLDRETSGVVLAAKDLLSRSRVGRQFEARSIRKVYLAVVEGEMAEDEGLMDLPLGRDLHSAIRLKMAVRPEDGQPSRTRFRVRRRVRGRSLVELHPETGRQHQLRVHLAALGHPITGDKLYLGGDEVFLRHVRGELTEEDHRRLGLPRQALHAFRLGLEHPFTGEPLWVEAPLAADMAALVEEGMVP